MNKPIIWGCCIPPKETCDFGMVYGTGSTPWVETLLVETHWRRNKNNGSMVLDGDGAKEKLGTCR